MWRTNDNITPEENQYIWLDMMSLCSEEQLDSILQGKIKKTAKNVLRYHTVWIDNDALKQILCFHILLVDLTRRKLPNLSQERIAIKL